MGRALRSWYRKSNKTWYVELNGKQIKVGKTKKEADAAVKELRRQKPSERIALFVTTAEVVDKYLDWCEENRATRTYEWYQDFLQKFLNQCPVAKSPVSELNAGHVTNWVSGNGWKPSTRRGAMIAVQRVFTWAARHGVIDKNPIGTLEKPMAERRESYISREELQTLMNACKHQQHKDLLEFAFESGARPQEVRKLEGKHFNEALGAFVLPVSRSKGKKKVRVIYLSEKALEITRRLMNDGHILKNSRGRPWTAFAINNLMCRLEKSAGLKFCLYAFRHGRANQLLEEGVDHLTVARFLGHSDGAMLARVYSHLSDKHVQDALAGKK